MHACADVLRPVPCSPMKDVVAVPYDRPELSLPFISRTNNMSVDDILALKMK